MGDHTHSFTELKLYPIKKVHFEYRGTPGDKAFITRACSCGKVRAEDFGKTEDMQIKYKELTQSETQRTAA